MQKKKSLNFLKFNKFKLSKNSAFLKRQAGIYAFKKYLKNKSYSFSNNIYKGLVSNNNNAYQVNILFKSNNFFCTLSNLRNKHTFYTISSGNYKVKTSKKILKHTFKFVLSRFFRIINKKVKTGNLLIKLTSPIHLRKKVLDIVAANRLKSNLIVRLCRLKCYNGCRPAKKQRKKRKGLRLLK